MNWVDFVPYAVLFVGNAVFDLWLVATRAGRQSLERFKSWFKSKESDEFKDDLATRGAAKLENKFATLKSEVVSDVNAKVAEVRAAVLAEVGRSQVEIQGRTEALGGDLRERIGSLDHRIDGLLSSSLAGLEQRINERLSGFDERLTGSEKAVHEQVQALETSLGGRLPSDLPGLIGSTIDTKVKEMEARERAEYAGEIAEMRAAQRNAIAELKADPRVAQNPGLLNSLDRMDTAVMPRRFRKRAEEVKAYVQMFKAATGKLGAAAPGNGAAGGVMPNATPPPPPGPTKSNDPNYHSPPAVSG